MPPAVAEALVPVGIAGGVVSELERRYREHRRGTIGEHAVASANAVLQSMQQAVVEAGTGKVTGVERVSSYVGVVGSYIHRVGCDVDRGGEIDLLPTRGGLVAKGRLGEQLAGTTPQAAHVSAGIEAAFIESNPGDLAVLIRPEFDAQLHRIGVSV
jgi:hypothetical protein